MAHATVQSSPVVITAPLDEKELAKVLAANPQWPFAASQDGWCIVHSSIRMDMRNIVEGVTTTLKQVEGGRPMEAWQPANLAKFFPMFHAYVHEHHETEEHILFPWLCSRITLPPKMSADHVSLMASMDKCLALATGMRASGDAGADAAQLRAFLLAFEHMQALMLEHFAEEEEGALPLLRKYFTYTEFVPIEKKIVAKLTTHLMAHFLSCLTLEEKRSFMTNIAHIPGFVQNFIILPACKKYSQEWSRLVEELKAGQRTPKPRGLLSLFRSSSARQTSCDAQQCTVAKYTQQAAMAS